MEEKNKRDEILKKIVRLLSPGEKLFEQGETGNTMFIIMEGEVELYDRTAHGEVKIDILGAGEVLGEKVMLSSVPYPRVYGARARTTTSLLEFASENIRLVETIIPDFSLRILKMAAKRLDRANRMITLLRSLDPLERIVQAIVFLCDEKGKKTSEGIHVEATASDLGSLTSVDADLIETCLDHLQQNNLLRKLPNGFFVHDANALGQALPDLRERIAA